MVVRYRIDGGTTDALGHLVACDAGAATVRTRQADVVIPLERVVAASAGGPGTTVVAKKTSRTPTTT